jgi:hypothetical protein
MKNIGLKIRWLLAIACTITVGFAPVRASSDSVATWRAFFQTVIPAAATNFTSLRGAFDSASGNYAVKGPFYPQLVHDCMIFSTGAGNTQAWDLRCQLTGYSGQAMGPGTPEGQLVHDLTAALPHLKRGSNMMNEPQWKDGTNTAVTIVMGGILIAHGYTGI